MFIYKVGDNNKIVMPAVKNGKFEVGKIYNVFGRTSRVMHNDQPQIHFTEYNYPHEEVMFVTAPDGGIAFAISSNDCERDPFEEFCLAKPILAEGNFVVHGIIDTDNNVERVTIFEVADLCPDTNDDSVNLRAIQIYENGESVSPTNMFNGAVDHARKTLYYPINDYLTPKYSYNPGRIVMTRLFHQDDVGELVSYTDQAQKLIISRKSKERYANVATQELHKNVFLRCFINKRHRNEEIIFVDGYPIEMIDESDLAEFAMSTSLTKRRAQDVIKKVRTKWGTEFYATVNIGGEGDIRPIYRTSDGFATFALSIPEGEFIEPILEDVGELDIH